MGRRLLYCLVIVYIKTVPSAFPPACRWPTLPQGILGLPGLVVLNASHNELKEVQEGVVPQ
jgi:hypothetical protein